MQEIITTGKTVDEAVEAACKELGLSRDDVTVEIIEMPQKKLFGAKPAQVKVSAIDEGFSVKALFAEQDRKSTEQKKPQKQEQPKKPEQNNRPQKQNPSQPKPQPEKKAEPQVEIPEYEKEIAESDIPEAAMAALNYLKEITKLMGAEKLSFKTVETERGIKFLLDGEDASLIIGRRGETMDAMQYLCTLVCNRAGGDYSKVSLDVANYRSKREKTLIALAEREAAKVKKSRFSKTLDPMNPYERRIVHSAVQNIEGVKSESVGFEPNRRVVISLISGGKTRDGRSHTGNGARGGYNRKPNGDRSGGFDSRPREKFEPAAARPAEAKAPAKESAPAAPTSLYTKIEL